MSAACRALTTRAGEAWWTSLDETGHWVLVVSKEEFQIGIDPWGFPHGGLKRSVLTLVPKPPEVVTALEIATQINRGGSRPTRDFLKAVQRCLRECREEGTAVSCPVGDQPQLGWHLPEGA